MILISERAKLGLEYCFNNDKSKQIICIKSKEYPQYFIMRNVKLRRLSLHRYTT
jgi:hypothetical protein